MERFYCYGKKGYCHTEDCVSCDFWDGSGGEKRNVENPYWERIEAIADRQREKGIQSYGQGIESNPADIVKRLEFLQEELVDALMYCEWIKDKVLEMEGENK